MVPAAACAVSCLVPLLGARSSGREQHGTPQQLALTTAVLCLYTKVTKLSCMRHGKRVLKLHLCSGTASKGA